MEAQKDKVVRYAAGESILLGYPQSNKNDKPLEADKSNGLQAKAILYSAGDSIPLGVSQAVPQNNPVELAKEKESHPQVKAVQYSAGDSIPLGYPQEIRRSISPDAKELGSRKKSAGYSSASYIPLAGALGDSATTQIGLAQSGLVEKNGLINASPAGLIGLFVIKAGAIYYFDQQAPEKRKSGLKTSAGIWGGISMNNLLLIAGSSNPVSVVGGALFGAYMYYLEGMVLEKEDASQAAQGFKVKPR